MDMVDTRIKTSQVYDEPMLEIFVEKIRGRYTPAILAFVEHMKSRP